MEALVQSNAVALNPPFTLNVEIDPPSRFHVGTVSANSIHGLSLLYFITAIYLNYNNNHTENIFQRQQSDGWRRKMLNVPFTINTYSGRIYTTKHFVKMKKSKSMIFFIKVTAMDFRLQYSEKIYRINIVDNHRFINVGSRQKRQANITSGVLNWLSHPQFKFVPQFLGDRLEILGCNFSKFSLELINVRNVTLRKNNTITLANSTDILGDFISSGTYVKDIITASDNGVYICYAANGTHEITSNALVLPVLPLPERLEVKNLSKPIVIQNEDVNFIGGCRFESQSDMSQYAFWFINSTEKFTNAIPPLNITIVSTSNSSLFIKWKFSILFTPRLGFFQCAFDILGVIVLSPKSDFAIPPMPFFTTPPSISGIYNNIGDSLTIVGCVFFILFEPSSNFQAHLLNNGQIKNTLSLSLVSEQAFILTSTTITETTISDSGFYQCQIFDEQAMFSPVLSDGIFVFPQAHIPQIYGEVSINDGSAFNLTCESVANVSNYRWYHNGSFLLDTPNKEFKMISSRNFSGSLICETTIAQNVKVNSTAINITIYYMEKPVINSINFFSDLASTYLVIEDGKLFDMECRVVGEGFRNYDLSAKYINVTYTTTKHLTYNLIDINGNDLSCDVPFGFIDGNTNLTWTTGNNNLTGIIFNETSSSIYGCILISSNSVIQSNNWFQNVTLLEHLTSAVLYAGFNISNICRNTSNQLLSTQSKREIVWPGFNYTLDKDVSFALSAGSEVPFTLICEVDTNPQVVWFRWFRDGIQLEGETAIATSFLVNKSSNVYSCEASNDHFVRNSSRLVKAIYFSHISFTGNNASTTAVVVEGSPVNFSCVATLENKPKDGSISYTILDPNSNATTIQDIQISSVSRLNHASTYKCTAGFFDIDPFLVVQAISDFLTLNVQYPPGQPRLSPNITSIKLKLGDSIRVSCIANDRGNPFSPIRWLKDGVAGLPTNFNFTTNEFILTLTVQDKSSSGNYACQLENIIGNSSKAFQLISLVPSDPPSNLQIISTTSTTVVLSWSTPLFDGNSLIRNYSISYQSFNSSQSSKVAVTNLLTFNITGLMSDIVYEVCVFANNENFVYTNYSAACINVTTSPVGGIVIIGNNSVIENSFLELVCQQTVSSLNISRYHWFKNDHLLTFETSNIRVVLDRDDDNSVFQCQIIVDGRKFNSTAKTIKVYWLDEPVISDESNAVVVINNQVLFNLSCNLNVRNQSTGVVSAVNLGNEGIYLIYTTSESFNISIETFGANCMLDVRTETTPQIVPLNPIQCRMQATSQNIVNFPWFANADYTSKWETAIRYAITLKNVQQVCSTQGFVPNVSTSTKEVLWLETPLVRDKDKIFVGKEFTNIKLSCQSMPTSSSNPITQYRWFENDQRILPDTTQDINITLSRIMPLYKCQVYNGFLMKNSSSRRIETLYLDQPVLLGNEIENEITVRKNRQLTINCVMPNTSFNSFFGLSYNISIPPNLMFENGSIVIDRINISNEGISICQVKSMHGNVMLTSNASLNIIVDAAPANPYLSPTGNIVKRKPGENYSVECISRNLGKPAATIQWYLEPDRVLINNTVLATSNESRQLEVQVTNESISYTCVVENYVRLKIEQLQIIPLLRPGAPRNVTILRRYSKLIEIKWDHPTSDGNSPITNFTIKLFFHGSQLHQNIGNLTRITFQNLIPNTSYTATVEANSDYYIGGNPRISIDILTQPPDPVFLTSPTLLNPNIIFGNDVIIFGCRFEASYNLSDAEIFYLKNNNTKQHVEITMHDGISYINNLTVPASLVKDGDYYQCGIFKSNAMENSILSNILQFDIKGFTLRNTIIVNMPNNPSRSNEEIKDLLKDEIERILERSFNKDNLKFTDFNFNDGNLLNIDFVILYEKITNENEVLRLCIEMLQKITRSNFQTLNVVDITVKSYTCCNKENQGEEDYYGVYTYESILINNYVTLPCVYNSDVMFNRSCNVGKDLYATWQVIDYASCDTKSAVTKELENLEKTSQSICNETIQTGCSSVVDVSNNLNNVTSANNLTSSKDVTFVQATIQNIVTSSTNLTLNETLQVSRDIFTTVNNLVVNTEEKVLDDAQLTESSSNNIIKGLNTQSQTLRLRLLENNETETFKVETKTVVYTAVKTPRKNIRASVVKNSGQGDNDFSVDINEANNQTVESAVQVDIPVETFPLGTGNEVVSCIFHRESNLFRTTDQLRRSAGEATAQQSSVQSFILAVIVGNQIVENLTKPVSFRFEKINNVLVDGNTTINYWDVNEPSGIGNILGAWSTRGITTFPSTEGNFITGESNHLTNFALLLNVGQTANNPLELQIVTWIGCGISMACLLFSVITFLLFRHLLKKMPQKILLSLCTSLLVLLIVFVVGAERTSSKIGCQIVAGMLHYFLLTTFLWMFIEACNLYRSFVKVFGTGSNRSFFVKSSLLCWVLPFVIVVICGASSPDSYSGNNNVCIVSGLPFYIAVLVPIVIIIVFNFIILIIVMKVLTASKNQRGKSQDDKDHFASVRIAFSCNLLLGITWVFAAFAIGEATSFFQWCFCITNSLQGFFIFVFYVYRSQDVRKAWLSLFGVYSGNSSISQMSKSKFRSTLGSTSTTKV